jgi:hypothetical protein
MWRFDIVYSGYAHRVTLDEVVAYWWGTWGR